MRDGSEDNIVVRNHQGNERGALDAGLAKDLGIRCAAGNHTYPPCSCAIACLRVQFDHNEIYLAAPEEFYERAAGQSVAGYDNIGNKRLRPAGLIHWKPDCRARYEQMSM
jgi:hypothetical protein